MNLDDDDDDRSEIYWASKMEPINAILRPSAARRVKSCFSTTASVSRPVRTEYRAFSAFCWENRPIVAQAAAAPRAVGRGTALTS